METKKLVIDGKKIAIGAAKLVLGGIASFGAGFIITRYGKAAILKDDKGLKKVVMLAGATVLSSMVGDAASNYVGKQIDTTVETFEKASKIGMDIKKMTNEDFEEFAEEESTDNG